MNVHDLLMVLVMSFPMFLFTVYPAIKLSEYLSRTYHISETQKRSVLVTVTFLSAFILSSLLYFL